MKQIAIETLTQNQLHLTKSASNKSSVRTIVTFPELGIFSNEIGWVVVSGDERTQNDILAYGVNGNLDWDNAPENFKQWISKYQNQIKTLNNNATAITKTENVIPGKPVVAPLIKTQWNQEAPFFNNCPIKKTTYSDGTYANNRTVVGCVALALAQILNYWKWPSRGMRTHTDSFLQTETVDFSQSAYDWNNILDYYETDISKNNFIYDGDGNLIEKQYFGNWNETQVDAVAKLCYDCGVAVDSDYGVDATSAYTPQIIKALCLYFDYSTDVKYLARDGFEADWDSLLRAELDAGRPIIYGGDNIYGGHQFLCDGYDSNGYFHFNFGWSDYADGYFVSTVIGNTYDCYHNQDILYNIHPAVSDNDRIILYDGMFLKKSNKNEMTIIDFDSIGNDGCYTLQNHIVIEGQPYSLKLGDTPFLGHNDLKEIDLTGLKYISPLMFSNCRLLESVTFDDELTTIDYGAF